MKTTKPLQTNRNHILALAATVIAFSLGIYGMYAYSKKLIETGRNDGIQQALEASAIKGELGSTVSNGVLEITAKKIEPATTIPGVFELKQGSSAYCLDISLRNISASEKLFIPLEELQLTDSDGLSYPIEAVLSCSPGIGGPIQTGEVLEGRVGFMIPEKASALKLQYTPIENYTKSFIISLK